MLNNKVEQRAESMPIAYEVKLAGIVIRINILNIKCSDTAFRAEVMDLKQKTLSVTTVPRDASVCNAQVPY